MKGFESASRRTELTLTYLQIIAGHGERGNVDSAFRLLQELSEFVDAWEVIDQHEKELTRIQPGNGRWKSAHVSVVSLARNALERLFYPATTDLNLERGQNDPLWVGITDPAEQWKRAEILLAERWRELVVDFDELRDRLHWERAWMGVEPCAVLIRPGVVQIGEQNPISLPNQYAVVLDALVSLRAAESKELERYGGGPKMLREMLKSFPQLKPYVHLPGGKGKGGYSTTIRPASEESR